MKWGLIRPSTNENRITRKQSLKKQSIPNAYAPETNPKSIDDTFSASSNSCRYFDTLYTNEFHYRSPKCASQLMWEENTQCQLISISINTHNTNDFISFNVIIRDSVCNSILKIGFVNWKCTNWTRCFLSINTLFEWNSNQFFCISMSKKKIHRHALATNQAIAQTIKRSLINSRNYNKVTCCLYCAMNCAYCVLCIYKQILIIAFTTKKMKI